MIKFIIELLLMFAKTETAKEIGKYAVKKVVDSTDNSIDNEMALELLGDISKSTGNLVKETALKEVRETISKNVDVDKLSAKAYNFLTDRL